MAELPFMPLDTGALTGDTTHMSAEEFGAYVRILVAMWRHKGQLRNDEIELARIAGVSLKRWKSISSRVSHLLTVESETISQKRLLSIWLDTQELRKKRAHSANVRWGKVKANGMHLHVHSQSKRNA